jgi:hypothetical protein
VAVLAVRAPMTSSFPQFDTSAPLDAQRTWTAAFDSYDQRNEDVCFVVTIHEAEREVTRFMAQVLSRGPATTGPARAR